MRHIHPTSGPLGISGAAGSHHLPQPHQSQQEMGMMGKPFSQYGAEPLMAGGLEELRCSSDFSFHTKVKLSFFIDCLDIEIGNSY